ncbi:hypothetical protein K474DRAFT_1685012 [Panus rudis PR-1116 ss-1]|nr:hypothetical protein K474DRAFT_1685012 [Panus rudis PR-1116 ss-1]
MSHASARESPKVPVQGTREVIFVDDSFESDEILARRLHDEWNEGDSDVVLVDDISQPKSLHASTSTNQQSSSDAVSIASHVASRVTADQDLARYRPLFTRIRECPHCSRELESPRGYVTYSPQVPPPSLLYLLHVRCNAWGLCPVLTCCTEVRAIALFEALGGFDRVYLAEQEQTEARSRERMSKTFKSATTDSDSVLVRALTTITMLLPSPYCDHPQAYDFVPHESISSLISLSQLPVMLSRLLRNDSVADWILHEELYQTMLTLLRRLADCEITMQILAGQRHEFKSSCGIAEWMWNGGSISWDRADGELVQAAPLYTYFQKLTKQCEAFIAGASQLLESGNGATSDEDIDTTLKATSLCGDIISARDAIDRAMKVMGIDPVEIAVSLAISTKGKDAVRSSELDHKYEEDCQRLSFRHVNILHTDSRLRFHYAREVASTANASRNPKDRLHLIKELAVMATSLPVGIWVRVDEVRNDVIKVMIAGPVGTPYEGGLFEFDCFIPLEYPHKPPLMNLCTTGSGTVRFNPNLYNCGKVCLSLLGTWAGRPGMGKADPRSQRSIEYNENIRLQTARWAIVDWLKDDHRDTVWADVIASHFQNKQVKVRKIIEEVANSKPPSQWQNVSNPSIPMVSTFGGGLLPGQYTLSSASRPVPLSGPSLLTELDNGIKRIQKWKVQYLD